MLVKTTQRIPWLEFVKACLEDMFMLLAVVVETVSLSWMIWVHFDLTILEVWTLMQVFNSTSFVGRLLIEVLITTAFARNLIEV